MNDDECVMLDRTDLFSSTNERETSSTGQLSSVSMEKFSKETIMLSLKYKKDEFKIIDKNSNASCWINFGLPARVLGPEKFGIIPKFASCKHCFQTYSYSSSTSTLSNHKCPMLSNKNQSKMKNAPMSQSTITIDEQTHGIQTISTKTLEKYRVSQKSGKK